MNSLLQFSMINYLIPAIRVTEIFNATVLYNTMFYKLFILKRCGINKNLKKYC